MNGSRSSSKSTNLAMKIGFGDFSRLVSSAAADAN
jgi:hypothetical protein